MLALKTSECELDEFCRDARVGCGVELLSSWYSRKKELSSLTVKLCCSGCVVMAKVLSCFVLK